MVYCSCWFCFVQIVVRGDGSQDNVGSGTASRVVELTLGGQSGQAPQDRMNRKIDLGVSFPGPGTMISFGILAASK